MTKLVERSRRTLSQISVVGPGVTFSQSFRDEISLPFEVDMILYDDTLAGQYPASINLDACSKKVGSSYDDHSLGYPVR